MTSIRKAKDEDIDCLAEMAHLLIKDEGHRSTMNVPELKERMTSWLHGEYHAVIIEVAETIAGYTLWRESEEGYFIRQFFIGRNFRRKNVGRKAIALLKETYWKGKSLQLEVLIGNERGQSFWRSVGFSNYSFTMECDNA